MNRLAVLIATWFGCGYFPWGPGTVGSLAAVFIAWVLHISFRHDHMLITLLMLALLLPGMWAATRTARLVAKVDPGMVVVDEVLGQWLTLLGAVNWNWKTFLAGFLLFRLFDIWKPWPIRALERLPEGAGIVADDMGAGLFGAVVLSLSGSLGFY